MPGIAGMISRRPAELCQRQVQAMIGAMGFERHHRSGFGAAPGTEAYAGWIALEHSAAARQPIWNARQDVALFFSGECYSDPVANAGGGGRPNLSGVVPVERILEWYEAEGPGFVRRLNGIFSGLLVDPRANRVLLFNDRYGVDRIYWHQSEDAFYFASEAKAILRVRPELRRFDPDGVAQYLAFGCNLGTQTLFSGIQTLPAAALWTFEAGMIRRDTYFSPKEWEALPALSLADFEAAVQERLRRIVPRYFSGTGAEGISLTGGFDTRMIMACLAESESKPVCYTFGGQRGETLDARLSARIARHCGLQHQVLRIGPDYFPNFGALADRTVFATDGCFGVAGAHEIYMNAQARRLAPVRVTGNYGGEVLRGVSTFKPIGLAGNLVAENLQPAVAAAEAQIAPYHDHPVSFSVFREIPWNLFGNLMAGRSQINFRTPYLDNELVALAYQCPTESRKSRLPALRLVGKFQPGLARIPTDKGYAAGQSKAAFLLHRSYCAVTFKLDYINNEGFPNWLAPVEPLFRFTGNTLGFLGLHKHLHYRNWFRNELGEYVREHLARVSGANRVFWNQDFLNRMAEEHIMGRKNYVGEINMVLTLDAVERLLFRNLPVADSGGGGTVWRTAQPAAGPVLAKS